MIRESRGNLLTTEADALVNTVNTVGVAGKGIALQFRQAFPDNFRAYERAAKRGEVVPGSMFVWATNQLERPHYIINFPTKRHWRGRSRIEDIRAGLEDLVRVIDELNIESIAVPPLGCGNGGLQWSEVRPLIISHLADSAADVVLFPPAGAPDADQMIVRTERPRMTVGRAALLLLIRQYRESDCFRLSALEVQKLAYFLQVSGEPLRLTFRPAQFGPYAENLNHVLIAMEGHFTRGFGDRSTTPRIKILNGAANEAEEFLSAKPETLARLRKVSDLVEGWETPYSLELPATVHWALTNTGSNGGRAAVHKYVASWTTRKAKLFKPMQVDRAIEHLNEHGMMQLSLSGA